MLYLPWKNRDPTIPTCVYKCVSYKGAQFCQYLMKVKPTLHGKDIHAADVGIALTNRIAVW